MSRLIRVGACLTALVLAGTMLGLTTRDGVASPSRWRSRAIQEARGETTVLPDGRRIQVRYPKWPSEDFGAYRGLAYGDVRVEPPVTRAAMPTMKGQRDVGRQIVARSCTGCHVVPGTESWPGNLGPDLSDYGARRQSDDYTFTVIYDARSVFPGTVMPPWGTTGLHTVEEIVHMVAHLQSLSSVPQTTDPGWSPSTRPKPEPYLGDPLDAMNNPAVVFAQAAATTWATRGPNGPSCADCHGGEVETAMRGVATRYPRHHAAFGRVMGLEDFVAVHAPETTGVEMAAEDRRHVHLVTLIKMASNGLPVDIDVTSREHQAAWERGRISFSKRAGQRNHACSDCHGTERAAGKWVGARFMSRSILAEGFTRHFPAWRTSWEQTWTLRRRMQWCMVSAGINMLAADAVEHAELELYLASFERGKPMSVPGLGD